MSRTLLGVALLACALAPPQAHLCATNPGAADYPAECSTLADATCGAADEVVLDDWGFECVDYIGDDGFVVVSIPWGEL